MEQIQKRYCTIIDLYLISLLRYGLVNKLSGFKKYCCGFESLDMCRHKVDRLEKYCCGVLTLAREYVRLMVYVFELLLFVA